MRLDPEAQARQQERRKVEAEEKAKIFQARTSPFVFVPERNILEDRENQIRSRQMDFSSPLQIRTITRKDENITEVCSKPATVCYC
jgi:hypothetical protein